MGKSVTRGVSLARRSSTHQRVHAATEVCFGKGSDPCSRASSAVCSGPDDYGSSRGPSGHGDVSTALPVKTKQWFFSRSELAFFQELKAALPSGYWVFPNVCLNDLIKPGGQQRATYARLRDKHVDFLIVRASDFRP